MSNRSPLSFNKQLSLESHAVIIVRHRHRDKRWDATVNCSKCCRTIFITKRLISHYPKSTVLYFICSSLTAGSASTSFLAFPTLFLSGAGNIKVSPKTPTTLNHRSCQLGKRSWRCQWFPTEDQKGNGQHIYNFSESYTSSRPRLIHYK